MQIFRVEHVYGQISSTNRRESDSPQQTVLQWNRLDSGWHGVNWSAAKELWTKRWATGQLTLPYSIVSSFSAVFHFWPCAAVPVLNIHTALLRVSVLHSRHGIVYAGKIHGLVTLGKNTHFNEAIFCPKMEYSYSSRFRFSISSLESSLLLIKLSVWWCVEFEALNEFLSGLNASVASISSVEVIVRVSCEQCFPIIELRLISIPSMSHCTLRNHFGPVSWWWCFASECMEYSPLGTQQALRIGLEGDEGNAGFQFEAVCWKFSAKCRQNPLNEPELMIAPHEQAEIVVWSSVKTRKSPLSSTVGKVDAAARRRSVEGARFTRSVCCKGTAMPKSMICNWNIRFSSLIVVGDDGTWTRERNRALSLLDVVKAPRWAFQCS